MLMCQFQCPLLHLPLLLMQLTLDGQPPLQRVDTGRLLLVDHEQNANHRQAHEVPGGEGEGFR